MAMPLLGRRVMLVDDDPLSRRALAIFLTTCRADVVEVGRAREALVEPHRYDAAVVNPLLQRGVGLAVIGALRAEHPRLLVVAVASATLPKVRDRLRREGVPFLSKPVPTDELRNVLVRKLTAPERDRPPARRHP